MRYSIILLFLLIPILSQAEKYKISGQFSDHQSKTVYLAEILGDKTQGIDSTLTTSEGKFEFTFTDSTPIGMYRIYTQKGGFLDLIFNKENISFSSTADKTAENVQIIESLENKLYYDYLKKRNYDQYRLEVLQPVVSYYPFSDPFYPQLRTEFSNIQEGLDQYIQSIVSNYSESYVAKILRIDRKPIIEGSMSPGMQKVYLRQHYFDGKSFNEPDLLRSNTYSGSILNYLALYQDNEMSKEDLEREFMIAVDSIMINSSENVRVNEFIAEYLIDGFEQFGFYKVMTHVAESIIIDESCENPELKQRVETLKKLVPGKPAPDIKSFLLDGKNFNLRSISKKLTLVLFWSSECPHCSALLPELHEFYKQNKGQIEIVAISIDTSSATLKDYLKDLNYEWINVSDYKGWDGKAPLDYGIFTTPNMFLLDANKTILTHPASILDIVKFLD